MNHDSPPSRGRLLHMDMSDFWSGDLGLTLITISLIVIIFIITPMREAGLPGRVFFDLLSAGLLIFAALTINQSRLATAFDGVNLMSSAPPAYPLVD